MSTARKTAAKVKDFGRREGVIPEDSPRANGAEAPPLKTINGKPALKLPGDGRPLGDFARDVGTLLAGKAIFARKGCAFTLDVDMQRLEVANATWLRSWAEKFVTCYRIHKTQGGTFNLASTMSEDAARVVLQAPQFLERLQRVERLHPCRMPVVRANGELELLPEGHDAESATFTAAGSPYPLDMSADEARNVIGQALAEFPFAEDSGRSKAVSIGALLTVFAGGVMPAGSTRPVFFFFANAEGAGKTTLAKFAGIPYGAAAAETAPPDEAEWRKALLTLVVSGRRLLLLDNLKGYLNSPSLEAYTTSGTYSGRILGVSKEFSGEACATVLLTGNRLTISPDMRRRSLTVELFTTALRAEDREFARPLDEPELLALRPRLLAAAWALVRSWNDAGRPPATRTNSSFPRWCATIGGMVEHAGFGCPTAPAEISGMGDTDTRDIAKLGDEMVLGTHYTFADLVELCTEHGLFERFTSDTAKDGGLSPKAKSGFGKTLRGYDRRTIAKGVTFFIEGEGRNRRYLAK